MTSSSASLLALKAELQRAEEQARKRGAGSSFPGSSHTKLTLKNDSKVNRQKESVSSQRGTSQIKAKQNEETAEDDRISESRRKLEQKARLYEELQCKARESIAKDDSDDDDTGSKLAKPSEEHPLVDFEQKVLLDFAYEREKERRNTKSKPSGVDKTLQNPKFDSITDADEAQRERLQEKWKREAEQNDMKLETDGNLHYQDIRFDEIREHGTGYFQFARDTATRASQQADLRAMHADTESNRRKRDLVKLEREQALRARLSAVKRLRLGRSAEATHEDSDNDSNGQIDPDKDNEVESSSDTVGDKSKVA